MMGQSDALEPKRQPADTAGISGSSVTMPQSVYKRKRKDKCRVSLSKDDQEPRDKPAAKKTKLLTNRLPLNLDVDSEDQAQRSNGIHSCINGGLKQSEERLERMCSAVRTLLECVGEDPDREGLIDTPSRYAKSLLFLTKGYHEDINKVANNAFFYENHNEMVIVKDIEIYSLCEHHLVPFTGKMHIGYIPSNTVIGLSKLPRIAEMFSRRLQIQERLTKEVSHAISDILKPKGVVVVMESSHLCMMMRGVEKTGTTTITCCFLGCFEQDSNIRNEFLGFIGVNKT